MAFAEEQYELNSQPHKLCHQTFENYNNKNRENKNGKW